MAATLFRRLAGRHGCLDRLAISMHPNRHHPGAELTKRLSETGCTVQRLGVVSGSLIRRCARSAKIARQADGLEPRTGADHHGIKLLCRCDGRPLTNPGLGQERNHHKPSYPSKGSRTTHADPNAVLAETYQGQQ